MVLSLFFEDWGDFYFLIDVKLTFDGVFEMAPHPMYSVGYAGYYGISLISNSFSVLCVSLAAHAAQFVFLYLVEEPHIQKTYGSLSSSMLTSDPRAREILYGNKYHAYFRRDLIGFYNFDLYRSADLLLLWSVLFSTSLVFPFMHYFVHIPNWFFIAHCIFWRLFHTFGLGLMLGQQSVNKALTRHFIKYGGTNREAFANWKT